MKDLKNSEVFFTPRQSARYLNLSLSTIKNYIYSGKLKTLKTPGGHHRIRKSELLATMGEVLSDQVSLRPGLKGPIVDIIFGIYSVLGAFGDSLRLHSGKVSAIACNIAKKMGIKNEILDKLRVGALLHDVGKLGIDVRILTRPGRLSEEEFEIVKTHPEKGAKIIDTSEKLDDIREIIAQHHERWDGKGYPNRLLANKISKAACIVHLSEAYDAMTSPYSYKSPISKDQAISEIKLNKATQFDPEVVEAFLAII